MNHPSLKSAFSLAELLIVVAITSMLGAVALVTSVSLIRSFAFTEEYATAQSSMNRVIDYIATDIRSSQSVQLQGSPVTSMVTLGNSQTLTITKPAYYSSEDETNYTPLSLIAAEGGVVYGEEGSISEPLTVTYSRVFDASTDAFIFTRNGVTIAESATNLQIQITGLNSGRRYRISGTYFSNQRRSTDAELESAVEVMVRNPTN